MSFVHLHTHTHFSLFESTIKIEELALKVVELQMPACAITDHNNLFGAIKFYHNLKNKGIKPIIGQGFCLKGNLPHTNSRLNLLCIDKQGYQNLIKLSSLSYLEKKENPSPFLRWEWLEKYQEGLFLITGEYQSDIADYLQKNDNQKALQLAQNYQQIFGERFYLEISDNGLPQQKILAQKIQQLGEQAVVPIVATNPCFYLTPEDAFPQFVLKQMGKQKIIGENAPEMPLTEDLYFKSLQQMENLFSHVAPESLTNSLKIADACDLSLENNQFYLPSISSEEGQESSVQIHNQATQGLENRLLSLKNTLQWSDDLFAQKQVVYKKRLEYELRTIIEMGYAGYFLIVADFVLWAKVQKILVGPGRGSGAGSLVAYSLQITDIDPLSYDLLFERFLNPGRKSLPDLDIDFDANERARVIDYIKKKYGSEKVCQIATLGSLSAKAVIRGVARVLGIAYTRADTIARMIPDKLNISLNQAMEENLELAELQQSGQEKEMQLMQIALRLEGLNSNLSTHAAGIIIMDTDISTRIPLCTPKDNNEAQSQYSMEDAENQGAIKFDLLGLKYLTIIRQCLKLIQQEQPDFDIQSIPLNHSRVFRMLAEGRTIGVFQMESFGITKYIRQMKPTQFEDLIAVIALYRPGPLGAGMITHYIDRKKNKEPVTYPHPLTENILKETYGVMIYQEQIIQIVQEVGGFSLAEADIFRRAIGKKKKEILQQQRTRFVLQSLVKGLKEQEAIDIFEKIDKFGGYGFNKSHSAAYALISYQTAYLKNFYPKQFYVSLLNSESQNPKQVKKILSEIKKTNLQVVAPDINKSLFLFTIQEEKICFGFGAIKGIGKNALSGLFTKRKEGFDNLLDFCKALDTGVNAAVITSLIKVGALDSLERNRHKLFKNLDYFSEIARHNANSSEQMNTLMVGEDSSLESIKLQEYPTWSFLEELQESKKILGFYLNKNPISFYFNDLKSFNGLVNLKNLDLGKVKKNCWVACYIRYLRITLNEKNTKTAEIFLEDFSAEMVFFISLHKHPKIEPLLDRDRAVLVQFTQFHYNEQNRFFVKNIYSLEQVREDMVVKISLYFFYNELPQKEKGLSDFWQKIKDFILKNSDESYPTNIALQIKKEDDTIHSIELPQKVRASESFVDDLTRFLPLKNIHFDYKHNFVRELVRN